MVTIGWRQGSAARALGVNSSERVIFRFSARLRACGFIPLGYCSGSISTERPAARSCLTMASKLLTRKLVIHRLQTSAEILGVFGEGCIRCRPCFPAVRAGRRSCLARPLHRDDRGTIAQVSLDDSPERTLHRCRSPFPWSFPRSLFRPSQTSAPRSPRNPHGSLVAVLTTWAFLPLVLSVPRSKVERSRSLAHKQWIDRDVRHSAP
jgi:hypothetical protein